jgi:hypothetical protein
MRALLVRLFVVVAVSMTLSPGAAAGGYLCRDSDPVAAGVAIQGSVGPSCSFVVSCPTNRIKCTLSANAIASGLGYVGVQVEIHGVVGSFCAGPASCQTGNTVKTLFPGDEVSVSATWGTAGTVPVTAAAGAQILLQAQRTDT